MQPSGQQVPPTDTPIIRSMKLLLPACLLLGLLTSAAGCRKNDKDEPVPAICPIEICPGAGAEVKTVTAVRGIVRQNPLTHEYQ
jgi:hypothetical protein